MAMLVCATVSNASACGLDPEPDAVAAGAVDTTFQWIKTCNRQGGICTLDWPFDPKTGLLKDFGLAQLKRIAAAIKSPSPH
jgi:hypothetical protein